MINPMLRRPNWKQQEKCIEKGWHCVWPWRMARNKYIWHQAEKRIRPSNGVQSADISSSLLLSCILNQIIFLCSFSLFSPFSLAISIDIFFQISFDFYLVCSFKFGLGPNFVAVFYRNIWLATAAFSFDLILKWNIF